MATKKTVEGKLKDLLGRQVQIKEIVNLIKSVSTFDKKTQQLISPQKNPYNGKDYKVDPMEQWADFKYQRETRYSTLLKQLERAKGVFAPALAGHIDVAVRKDGRSFVWDGLGRCIMAALRGIPAIPASEITHDALDDEQAVEAEYFSIKNGEGHVSMRAEELWKAQYVARGSLAYDNALIIAEVLDACNLDVLNVLGNKGWSFSGFSTIQTELLKGKKKVTHEEVIKSSLMIQEVFDTDRSIRGHLLLGLAYFLGAYESLEEDYLKDNREVDLDEAAFSSLLLSESSIHTLLTDWVDAKGTQLGLTSPTLSNKVLESVAFNIFRKVVLPNYVVSIERPDGLSLVEKRKLSIFVGIRLGLTKEDLFELE